jgi:hypothetical protein
VLARGTLVRLKEQYSAQETVTGWQDKDPRCNPGIVLESSGWGVDVFWANVEDVETWNKKCLEILS